MPAYWFGFNIRLGPKELLSGSFHWVRRPMKNTSIHVIKIGSIWNPKFHCFSIFKMFPYMLKAFCPIVRIEATEVTDGRRHLVVFFLAFLEIDITFLCGYHPPSL